MSLEGLLQLSSPTREQVIAEIDSGFYVELNAMVGFGGNHQKARVNTLLTEEVLRATSHVIRHDLESLGIQSLDAPLERINRLCGAFGFTKIQPAAFRKKLIDLGVFSTDLSTYQNTEGSFQKLVEPALGGGGPRSVYFSSEFVDDQETLESNRRLFVHSDTFKQYMASLGIKSLDDIQKRHYISSTVSLALGVNQNSPVAFRKKLIELGYFPSDLRSCDNVEQILQGAVDHLSITGRDSVYFDRKYVSSDEVLESNRTLFAQSAALKRYFETLGITTLDKIPVKMMNYRFSNILGLKGIEQFRKFLIKSGTFPIDFRACENLEDILSDVVEGLSNRRGKEPSVYFSQRYHDDSETLESNRTLFAQSAAFRGYLTSKGIKSLDDINKISKVSALAFILGGFKPGNVTECKKAMIKYGALSTDLRTYDHAEQTFQYVVANLSNHGKNSAYFSSEFVDDPETLESNRRLFAQSAALKAYFRGKGIVCLDDFFGKRTYSGLINAFGIDRPHVNNLRNKLAQLGAFSTRLTDYDNKEEVIAHTLSRFKDRLSSAGRFRSAYFSSELGLTPEVIEANRRTLLESKKVQDYFTEEGISLDNLSTIRTSRARAIFRELLGIDVRSPDSQAGLKAILPRHKTPVLPVTRKMVSVWDDKDIGYLREIASINGNNESTILSYLGENRQEIEEQLGRTIFACEMQMRYRGILPAINFGTGTQDAEFVYPFPKIHDEDGVEATASRSFGNYARLLEAGLEPAVTPVLAYESAVTYEGEPQFIHATVPINFRGADISDYNPFEQKLLRTVASYLQDPESFTPVQGETEPRIQGGEAKSPFILAVQKGNQVYAQVMLRSRFSENPGVVDTNAIKLNGSEIYFFKHDQSKVTFENTRA
jgi:hypothetical protein